MSGMTNKQWLLDVMGEHDFIIPTKAFNKIVTRLRGKTKAEQQAVAGDAVRKLLDDWRSEERNYADPPADIVIWAKHQCAERLAAALAQDRASQAGAAVSDESKWREFVDEFVGEAALKELRRRFEEEPNATH